MTVNTIKFSEFAQMNLGGSTNTLVGASSSSGGINVQVGFPLKWTTAGRPPVPGLGIMGYNVDLNSYEFWNGAAWIQFAAGGSGTVNSGLANQLAYYASSGTAISGLSSVSNAVLSTNGTGAPSWSATLPASLNIPTPNITGVTDASNAAAGSVGEFISSVRSFASAIAIATLTPANVTSIVLTAGDWDVWGNVSITGSGNIFAACIGWISQTSATLTDPSLHAASSGASALSGWDSPVPGFRFNLTAATTTIYLSVRAQFGAGTATACGGIYARRRR